MTFICQKVINMWGEFHDMDGKYDLSEEQTHGVVLRQFLTVQP